MWLSEVKVIVPPSGSRKCVIFKMLWIQHFTFTRFVSNFIRIMSKHGPCKTVEGILISKILLPWQRVKLEYSFPVILGQITCLDFMKLNTHISINDRYTLAKAHKRAWKRHCIAPPFRKLGGLVLSSHQTWYIFWSHQAGQPSNLQSLATTNRKSAILIWMWIFGKIWVWINAFSSEEHYTIHTKLCLHDAKTFRNLNL